MTLPIIRIPRIGKPRFACLSKPDHALSLHGLLTRWPRVVNPVANEPSTTEDTWIPRRRVARFGPPTPTRATTSVAASVDSTEARKATVQSFGRLHEWHVGFLNSFDHRAIELLSGHCQAVEVSRPPFRHVWPKAVGEIRNSVRGGGLQQPIGERARWP
jgi:hypothetical protein